MQADRVGGLDERRDRGESAHVVRDRHVSATVEESEQHLHVPVHRRQMSRCATELQDSPTCATVTRREHPRCELIACVASIRMGEGVEVRGLYTNYTVVQEKGCWRF